MPECTNLLLILVAGRATGASRATGPAARAALRITLNRETRRDETRQGQKKNGVKGGKARKRTAERKREIKLKPTSFPMLSTAHHAVVLSLELRAANANPQRERKAQGATVLKRQTRQNEHENMDQRFLLQRPHHVCVWFALVIKIRFISPLSQTLSLSLFPLAPSLSQLPNSQGRRNETHQIHARREIKTEQRASERCEAEETSLSRPRFLRFSFATLLPLGLPGSPAQTFSDACGTRSAGANTVGHGDSRCCTRCACARRRLQRQWRQCYWQRGGCGRVGHASAPAACLRAVSALFQTR